MSPGMLQKIKSRIHCQQLMKSVADVLLWMALVKWFVTIWLLLYVGSVCNLFRCMVASFTLLQIECGTLKF